MLKKQELEELVKRRRNVQDLDIESYLRIKADLLSLIMDVKYGNYKSLTTERIDKLETDLRLSKIKIDMSLDFDLAKYDICSTETINYDSNIRNIMTNYIISSATQFKILNQKIEFAKQLLDNRNKLNKTIQDYFIKAKIIKLTRKELNLLFDKDTNDLKLILSSGKLIHEDKSDPSNDEYEFTFSKSSSFRLTSSELEKKIQAQIDECDNINKHIEQSKEKWKQATTRLIILLDTIESEVQI